MFKTLSIIVAGYLFLGCTKEIKYDIPREDPMISMDVRLHSKANLFPSDSTIAVLSTTVYSLSGDQPELSDDYEVTLLEDMEQVSEFTPKSLNGSSYFYYETPYQPREGFNYRVEASKDGLPDAWGDCYIKPAVKIDSAFYDMDANLKPKAFITFSDPADTVDYYQIIVRRYTNEFFFDPLYIYTSDPLARSGSSFETPLENEGVVGGNSIYLSDQTFDGKKKTFEFSFEDDAPALLSYDYLNITVLRIDEDYYRHVTTLELAANGNENPFSEPVQVYSNVKNGVGAVLCGSEAAYRVERL